MQPDSKVSQSTTQSSMIYSCIQQVLIKYYVKYLTGQFEIETKIQISEKYILMTLMGT